jgi:hypothetical protein
MSDPLRENYEFIEKANREHLLCWHNLYNRIVLQTQRLDEMLRIYEKRQNRT